MGEELKKEEKIKILEGQKHRVPSRTLRVGRGCVGVISHAADLQCLCISLIAPVTKAVSGQGWLVPSAAERPLGSPLMVVVPGWLQTRQEESGDTARLSASAAQNLRQSLRRSAAEGVEKLKSPQTVLAIPFPTGLLGASRSKLFPELTMAA